MSIETPTSKTSQDNLYVNRDPRNYIVDGEPRALYWHNYRETYQIIKDQLHKGKKVMLPFILPLSPNSELPIAKYFDLENFTLSDIPIALIGNNLLKPFSFDVRKKDRTSIDGVNFPGKSATLAFSYNLSETCGGIFDRDCRRQDHLYITTANTISECNYSLYWLPTPNQPLHVRMVHKIHEENPEEHLPPFSDRTSLAEAFSLGKIV